MSGTPLTYALRNPGGPCRPALALCLLAAVAAGCSSEASAPTGRVVPAGGIISYKGKPLQSGTLTFEPVDGGREANASIGPDGSYTLTTFEKDDGAVAGVHRVSIPRSKPNLPVKYRNLASSGIEVEIKSGQSDYPIEIR